MSYSDREERALKVIVELTNIGSELEEIGYYDAALEIAQSCREIITKVHDEDGFRSRIIEALQVVTDRLEEMKDRKLQ